MKNFNLISILWVYHITAVMKIFNFNTEIFSNCAKIENTQEIIKNNQILPFTSIKMIDDDVFFTLSSKRDKWFKLLSLDNVGTDAFVKFSKDHYGRNKCDYQIECYKFHIISDFPKIFSTFQNKKFPERIGLEYEEDNQIQTGIDIESTNENFKINEKNLADNFKQSTKENSEFMKGINKLKKSFTNFFKDNDNRNGKLNETNSTQNLRKDILEIKKEIMSLEKEEKEIKMKVINNLNEVNIKLNQSKSFMYNIWKVEIIAGFIGAMIVFLIFAFYYIFNGIIQKRKSKPLN